MLKEYPLLGKYFFETVCLGTFGGGGLAEEGRLLEGWFDLRIGLDWIHEKQLRL